jgi:hypothetical protein
MNPENISIGVFALTIPNRFRDFGASLAGPPPSSITSALSSGIILLPHSPLEVLSLLLLLYSCGKKRVPKLQTKILVNGTTMLSAVVVRTSARVGSRRTMSTVAPKIHKYKDAAPDLVKTRPPPGHEHVSF